MSTSTTSEVLARSRALRAEAAWVADHTTPHDPAATARHREMRRNHRLLLEEVQRRHDVTVSLSWIRNALADIKEKDFDICHNLEYMIDTIQGVNYIRDHTSAPTTTPTPPKEPNSRPKSCVSESEETEDYGSCSSTEMSPPPSHSSSITTPSIDEDTRKELRLTFSEDDEDLGVFV